MMKPGIRFNHTMFEVMRVNVTVRSANPALVNVTAHVCALRGTTMSTGATDGRFLRGAGIPTYGVSGIFSESGETNAHGLDEKLRVKSYYDGLAFLDQLVRQVSTAPRT